MYIILSEEKLTSISKKSCDILKSRKFDRDLISQNFEIIFGSKVSRNLCLGVYNVKELKLVQTSGYVSSIKS